MDKRTEFEIKEVKPLSKQKEPEVEKKEDPLVVEEVIIPTTNGKKKVDKDYVNQDYPIIEK